MEKTVDKEIINKQKRAKLFKKILIAKFTFIYCYEKLYVFSREQKYVKPFDDYYKEIYSWVSKHAKIYQSNLEDGDGMFYVFDLDENRNVSKFNISDNEIKLNKRKIARIIRDLNIEGYKHGDHVKYVDDSLVREKNDVLYTKYSEIRKTRFDTIPYFSDDYRKPTFIKIQ